MTNQVHVDRAAMFKALGDPTRLTIFNFLRTCCCEVSVDEDGAVRPVSGPTVGEVCCHVTGAESINSTISHHLKELRLAGLIKIDRRGKNMVCGVNHDVIASLAHFLTVDGAECTCNCSCESCTCGKGAKVEDSSVCMCA